MLASVMAIVLKRQTVTSRGEGGRGVAKTSQKDTSVVPVAPAGLPLLRLRDLQVDQRHGLLVTDALLQVELHQGQHLCQGEGGEDCTFNP